MADRGFNIRHLLLPLKASLNIPAFSHGKVLSHKTVNRSRKIATVRIHVRGESYKTYENIQNFIRNHTELLGRLSCTKTQTCQFYHLTTDGMRHPRCWSSAAHFIISHEHTNKTKSAIFTSKFWFGCFRGIDFYQIFIITTAGVQFCVFGERCCTIHYLS